MNSAEESVIWKTAFEFATNKAGGGFLGESVNWDKYALPPTEVHQLGCERESVKRKTNDGFRYAGFITAGVSDIRSLRSKRGHFFEVLHVPDLGIHHAEIRCLSNPDAEKPMERLDRADLLLGLKLICSELVPHSCGS